MPVKSRHTGVLLAVAVALASALAPASASAASPRLVQLSYEHSRDGSSKHFNLAAYAHGADSVRFVVRRDHEPLVALGKYNDHVTDTDLHPADARHPWEADRRQGGKAVIRAIRSAIQQRGRVTIRVIARSGDARDKAKVIVDPSDCAMDPPLYPLSCEYGL